MNKATLYYGSGECSIEGSDIIALQISYTGKIKITDETSEQYEIVANDNMIIIFSLMGINVPISLNNLFTYIGEFKINSIISVNKTGRTSTKIKRVMDYSELLNTNAEDLTTFSEKIKTTYTHKQRINKTTINIPIINNLSTATQDGDLYLQSGKLYNGYFHIHKSTGKTMTGESHNPDSESLYIKPIVGKNAGKLIEPLFETLQKSRRRNARSGKTSTKKMGY